ncbi:MAG: MFS transporter [Candidatus Krumholzibacteriota bacterium]|nr:MFS transporter [Candidatus Krumholzibacteriota bacterium]
MKTVSENRFSKVLTISLAHLAHDTPTSFLAPILPLLIDKFGLSVFQAGLLDIFRRIPSLANPFLGLLADRICLRYFIIFTPGVTAALMSSLGIAPGYIFLSVLLLLSGISSALFHVTAPVMMRNVSPGRIGRGMSFYMLGGEMARTLGPLIILGAVSLWKLEGTYRLVPFAVLASLILYFLLKDVTLIREPIHRRDTGAAKTLVGLLPFFVSVTGIFLCRAAMKSALTIYLPTYLTSRGNSLWIAGISLAVLQFSGAGGTFLAGIISDRIGRKLTLFIITTINPFLMWAFMNLDEKFAIPVLIATGFFLFASGPVLLAMVHDIDSKRMSFINGIYMTLNFTLNSLMVLLVGLAADRIGLELTYRISAWVAAGSVPFVIFFRDPPALDAGGNKDTG